MIYLLKVSDKARSARSMQQTDVTLVQFTCQKIKTQMTLLLILDYISSLDSLLTYI